MQKNPGIQEQEILPNDAALKAREQIVQLSRRIDWRFLLPQPELREVAFIGSFEDELIEALQHFSGSLKIFSSAAGGGSSKENGKLFDVAVVNSASPRAVRWAYGMLKPGAYLYWEIKRGKSSESQSEKNFQSQNGSIGKVVRDSFPRFAHIRSYKQYLQEAGFREIEVNWHRPGFKSCKEIIPLEDSRALQYVFSRQQSSFRGQLKLWSGQFLHKSGLLPYIVPSFSLVAQRGL